jgi:hypothetical protein
MQDPLTPPSPLKKGRGRVAVGLSAKFVHSLRASSTLVVRRKGFIFSFLRSLRSLRSFVASFACAAAVAQTTNSTEALPTEPATNPWSFNASVYGYIVPESRDYVNPNFTADHEHLHFEARYNYEALETASLWAGYKFSTGEQLTFEFTPMLGGVFGNLTGVAPGFNLALGYKHFELSSQSEYFIDAADSSENYFYTWAELTYSPWEWLRFGLVTQRTRAYKSELDIQRGFLVGVSYRRIDLSTYVFNLGWTDPTVVLAMGFNF